MIKQNMVPLKADGSHSTYVLDDRKNSAVEIHFGTRYAIPPRQLSKVEPAVGRGRDTVDISSADFLILIEILPSTFAGNSFRGTRSMRLCFWMPRTHRL